METTSINVKYLNTLSDSEETLLNHFQGEWLSQDDTFSLDIRILYSTPSTLEDIYEIKSISTTDNEIALTPTDDSTYVITLKQKDIKHVNYQVINADGMGSSQPYTLEKG
ncbi:cysteine protease inhibitor staphostatin B [Staphylococcus simulans]